MQLQADPFSNMQLPVHIIIIVVVQYFLYSIIGCRQVT